jgi:hypothetical protein
MLKAALCGSYVNFGVFRLYGDEALDNALNTFVKLLLSIPQTDLLDYPKLSQTYYVLLDCLAQDHMTFLATLQPEVSRRFHSIIYSIKCFKLFYKLPKISLGFPVHSGLNIRRASGFR